MAAPTRQQHARHRFTRSNRSLTLDPRRWAFWLLLVAPSLLLAGCMVVPAVEGGWWVILAVAAALGLAGCKSSDNNGGSVTLAPVVSKLLGASGEGAGTSVAGGGNFGGDANDDIVIGAPNGYELGGVTYSSTGRAYVLTTVPPAGVSSLASAAGAVTVGIATAGYGNYNLGRSVAFTGDLDGDTYSELMVGTPNDSFATTLYGSNGSEAYVLAGAPTPPTSFDVATAGDVRRVVQEYYSTGWFQRSLGIGDFDGDGTPDLLVANPNSAGAIAIIDGSYASASTPPKNDISETTLTAPGTWSGFVLVGSSVSGGNLGQGVTALDWNGDGKADVAAGRPVDSSATATVHVILGASGALADNNAVECARSGDVTQAGDGGNFVPNCDISGHVMVHPAGFTIINGTSTATGGLFGFSLAAGDVNGDGHADLAIGSPGYSGNAGRVYLLLGDGTVPVSPPLDLAASLPGTMKVVTIDPPAPAGGDRFGSTLAMADLDGDGRDEVVIGAPDAASGDGQVTVVFGRADIGASPAVDTSGLTYGTTVQYNTDSLTVQGATGETLGASLANAGDIDGDGREDLLIGAPGPVSSAGAVYVIRLNPAP